MARSLHTLAASLLLAGFTAGCNTAAKPSDKNFTKALATYFSAHNECLYAQALRFPYELSAGAPTNAPATPGPATAPNARQLDALTKAGLLTREEEKDLKVKRYALTPFAEKATPRFCYGHREVTSIDGTQPVAPIDGRRAVEISYQYKMMDVPVWAGAPEVQKAFPQLQRDLSGQATDKTTAVLTLAGWQIPD